MGTSLTTSRADMGQVRLPSRKFVGLIVSLLFAVGAGTATADDISPQIWLDYNPLHLLSPRVDLFGDAGIRWNTENDGWRRFVLRPSVGVRAGQVYLTAGVGNFVTFSPDIATHWEIRPFQGASVVWPGGRLAFQHYLRLEERFDFNTDHGTHSIPCAFVISYVSRIGGRPIREAGRGRPLPVWSPS